MTVIMEFLKTKQS